MKDGNGKIDSSSTSVECKRCGDDGHKTVQCPGQICGVLCGGKGHGAEIFVMSSQSLRAKLLPMIRYSAVKMRRPSCVKYQARCLVLRYQIGEDWEIRVLH